jgi:hypothetical protein
VRNTIERKKGMSGIGSKSAVIPSGAWVAA